MSASDKFAAPSGGERDKWDNEWRVLFASQVPHSGDMMYQIQAGEWSILDSCGKFQPASFGHLQGEGCGRDLFYTTRHGYDRKSIS
jgi:hypothetical protein